MTAVSGSARRAVLAFAATLAVAATSARANPFELFGLTSRNGGRAGAGVAEVDDASASYYNPAGLAIRGGSEITLGAVAGHARLDHGGALPDPFGWQLALRRPLPLRGELADRVVLGLALHALPRDLVHVVAPPPERPYYVRVADRASRVIVMPALGVRLGRLAIGGALDILAGLDARVDAREGTTRALDAAVDARVPTVARGALGVSWQLSRWVRLAATFHQRFAIPIATRVRAIAAGEPIDLDLQVDGQFTPHTWTLGLGWRNDRHAIAFDVRYARWSDYRGPYVRVASLLPLVGDVPGVAPRVPFVDTVGAHLGYEASYRQWRARAGYAFDTAPTPADQPGVTNLLDGPHQLFAIGGGRMVGRMRIDVHAQLDVVMARTLAKTIGENPDPFVNLRDELADDGVQTSNPGYPTITGGGVVVAAGVSLEVPL